MNYFEHLEAGKYDYSANDYGEVVRDLEKYPCAVPGPPGLDDLRWNSPVYVGERPRVKAEIIDKRASRSKPGLGACTTKIEVRNQNSEVVLSYESIVLISRKPIKSVADSWQN
jgi:acyl dehydratase